MSSGFSGDYFPFTGRPRRTYNPQLSEIIPDPTAQILRRVPEYPGKRSLAEFQAQQQHNHALSLYLRNVKARTLGFPSQNTEITPQFSNLSAFNYPNLRLPELHRLNNTQLTPNFSTFNQPNLAPNVIIKEFNDRNTEITPNLGTNRVMNDKLQELEKQLLDDDEDEESEKVSVITGSEWSNTWQHLIGPPQHSHSPTSSCSSSCTSVPPPLSLKQSLLEAATAISENQTDLACEILTRLNQSACVTGTGEQRLTSYFTNALRRRVGIDHAPEVAELYSEAHAHSTHVLYDASPCFKLGFMAANLTILDATSSDLPPAKLHVIDFDISRGGQYMHLIHAIAARKYPSPLKITAITEFGTNAVNRLQRIGDKLKALATKVGVELVFVALSPKINDLSLAELGVDSEDRLAVNLPFKLYKLPDESVSTENFRDELLRRVKGLSPAVVTVVEQEMNTNTAPFLPRVTEACDYYSALFESLDSTVPRDYPDRVRIEEGLGRKLANAVACEGRERVERCEVFGKWRARMGMAGFRPRPMAQPITESLRARLSSGTRGNPGFTVKEENGGILFGWMGRTLTVASAWQ